jgi:AcrR family transcriptional regulator
MSKTLPQPKPARQKRSEETLARILKGTMAALKEKDLDEIGVDDIARAAGLTTGSIYSRFKGKEELLGFLLHSVQEKQLIELQSLLDERQWAGKGLEARIDWLVDQTRASALAYPGVVRALFGRQMKTEAACDPEVVRRSNESVDLICAWLITCADEITVPNREGAVRTTVCVLASSVHLAMLYPGAYPGVHDEAAVLHLRQMALAYLKSG